MKKMTKHYPIIFLLFLTMCANIYTQNAPEPSHAKKKHSHGEKVGEKTIDMPIEASSNPL